MLGLDKIVAGKIESALGAEFDQMIDQMIADKIEASMARALSGVSEQSSQTASSGDLPASSASSASSQTASSEPDVDGHPYVGLYEGLKVYQFTWKNGTTDHYKALLASGKFKDGWIAKAKISFQTASRPASQTASSALVSSGDLPASSQTSQTASSALVSSGDLPTNHTILPEAPKASIKCRRISLKSKSAKRLSNMYNFRFPLVLQVKAETSARQLLDITEAESEVAKAVNAAIATTGFNSGIRMERFEKIIYIGLNHPKAEFKGTIYEALKLKIEALNWTGDIPSTV